MMIYGILIAFVMGIGLAWWDGHTRLVDYQNAVRVVGEAQEERTKARIESDKRKKQEADSAHKTELARVTALVAGLRKSRPSSSFVPAAPSGASRPDLACYARPEYLGATGNLVEGLRRLADEGTEAAVGLNTAREWAKGRP